MSLENAKANLKEFGKELNLELAFDENNTCILGIDNAFSLHLTYEPNSDRLYLYSPILDGLPKDSVIRLRLYEELLQGSMLGGQMAGGGIGVAVPEELILMHAVLEMGVGADPSSLRRFAALFVEAVEKWRERAKNICAGLDFGGEGGGRGGEHGGKEGEERGRKYPTPGPGPGPGKPGGERYIKI